MDDFLAHLVTTGSAPAADVAPRLPSRFELMRLGPALDEAADGAGAAAWPSPEHDGSRWAAPRPPVVAREPAEQMDWFAPMSELVADERPAALPVTPHSPWSAPQDRAQRPPGSSRIRRSERAKAPSPLESDGILPPDGAAHPEQLQDERGPSLPEQSSTTPFSVTPDSRPAHRERAPEPEARRGWHPPDEESAPRRVPADDAATTDAGKQGQTRDESNWLTRDRAAVPEPDASAIAALPSPVLRPAPMEDVLRFARRAAVPGSIPEPREQLAPPTYPVRKDEAEAVRRNRWDGASASPVPRESAFPSAGMTADEQAGSQQRPTTTRTLSPKAIQEEERDASLTPDKAAGRASPWEEWLDARLAASAIVPRDTAIHDIRLHAAAPPVQPAPTIHVTIGRVEVRAAAPAAPAPRKTAAQPPVMSLEDYLRQRADGGRR